MIILGEKMTSIAVLGSHSALEICEGAAQEGFKTLVLAQRGREKTYLNYLKRKRGRQEIGVIDEVMLLDKFSDIMQKQGELLKRKAIIIPHRSFSVYVGHDNIAKLKVPVFGNRALLKAEERNVPKNQYFLLHAAGIRIPKQFRRPQEIDRLAIVKVSEARRTYERAFFLANSPEEYEKKKKELLVKGMIDEKGISEATIEEYIVGAQFNFNFFYSPIHEELELMGIDMRRQTNLDGFLHMPAREQEEARKYIEIRNIEAGHIACTLRESLLEKVFEIGEKFIHKCREEYAPGIIGPFALQAAIPMDEEPVVFDVSFRMPGSPGIKYTPYSRYLFREEMSLGRRIAIEIKEAMKKKKLNKILG